VTEEPDRLWRESYSKACRKNVNRADREGVTVRAASDADDVAEFHRIYIQTMERNEASATYFFDLPYFRAIFEEMPNGARFALAEHDGRVVAATLYLHDADDVYSYLGGADHDYQHLRPTNAVVHQTIAWAREQGKRRLVLGGGYRPDDGIFRFKASFSPLRATLRLARRVHLSDDYDALVEAWREWNPGARESGFFPLYRATT
jgi:lipid II:glycine glycyltransferase (peptidoglycan interpeptide bridge formation enzyme)